MQGDPLRRGVAEFVGAFTLIFIGAGAAVAASQAHDPTLIGVAVANGLAIGVMVSALGHISGCHFNPAITMGFLITRRIKLPLAVLYWLLYLRPPRPAPVGSPDSRVIEPWAGEPA
jgi:glycerol uptake facilitator-like aquaporin